MPDVTIKRSELSKIRDLPRILSGEAPDPKGIGRAFKAFFVRHFMVRVQQAYVAKGTSIDDLGNVWKPNAPATIKRKKHDVIGIGLRGKRKHDNEPFLIDSCKPGVVTGSTYLPPVGQSVSFDTGSISVKFELPHAKHFHAVRRIWPENYGPWLQAAFTEALTDLIGYVKQVGL